MESYSVGIKAKAKPSFTDGFKAGVELKMLRFPLEVTKMGKIRNEYNRRAVQVEQFGG